MIDIHISAITVEDLVSTINELSRQLCVAEKPASEEPLVMAKPEADPISAAEETGAEEPKQSTDEPVEKVTVEAARAALNDLRVKKGAAAVRKILERHKVASFVDLPTASYPAVIEEAEKFAAE